jgi:hypothetical protein
MAHRRPRPLKARRARARGFVEGTLPERFAFLRRIGLENQRTAAFSAADHSFDAGVSCGGYPNPRHSLCRMTLSWMQHMIPPLPR